jgi:hypothetical protein
MLYFSINQNGGLVRNNKIFLSSNPVILRIHIADETNINQKLVLL